MIFLLNFTGNVMVLPNCTYALAGNWAVVAPTHPLNGDGENGVVCYHRDDILTLETNIVTIRFNFDQPAVAVKITVKGNQSLNLWIKYRFVKKCILLMTELVIFNLMTCSALVKT